MTVLVKAPQRHVCEVATGITVGRDGMVWWHQAGHVIPLPGPYFPEGTVLVCDGSCGAGR